MLIAGMPQAPVGIDPEARRGGLVFAVAYVAIQVGVPTLCLSPSEGLWPLSAEHKLQRYCIGSLPQGVL